ncbi:MAG TPA: type II CAAX endopeptidase family protein [Bacteroidia bacterium]|nr:type II CAAX endopeptidase family protein [Bacteroidia bacterium]
MEHDDIPQPPGARFSPGIKFWLVPSLMFACSGIYTLIASSSKFAWMNAGPDDGYPVAYARWAEVIASVILFAIPAVVYANVFPPERFRWFRLDRKAGIAVTLLAVLSLAIAVVGFDAVYNWIGTQIKDPALKEIQESGEKNTDWILSMPSAGDLFFCLFVGALVPAFCEELFFRATFQQSLIEWNRKPHLSVWITAAFFSFMHFDIAGFPVIFASGLMLGYAFVRTGSLRVNILMHFVFNSVSILESFIAERSAAFKSWEPGIPGAAISFGLAGALFFFFWRRTRTA